MPIHNYSEMIARIGGMSFVFLLLLLWLARRFRRVRG